MGPRELQQQIHSTFSPITGVWSDFQSQIIVLYQATSGYADFNNHLLREYNRKVYDFGMTGLAFTPHDAGYRFLGTSIAAIPDSGYVFVFTINNDQVFVSGDAVQVPDSYANS